MEVKSPCISGSTSSRLILLCTYLSAVVLVGLLLSSLFGWSWVDPIAAIVIAVIATREGINAWKVDICCSAPAITKTAAAQGPLRLLRRLTRQVVSPRPSSTQSVPYPLCPIVGS